MYYVIAPLTLQKSDFIMFTYGLIATSLLNRESVCVQIS